MRTLAILGVALSLVSANCFAEAKGAAASPSTSRSSSGADTVDTCGLGWEVTNKKSFLATTTRGTTNNVVPPTIGMTLGTIGCEKHGFAKNEESAVTYALANQDALALELAQGYGEFVDGLAFTMGCNDAASFGKAMQQNYGSIVGEKANGAEMYKNVKQQISQNPALAASCGV